MTTTQTANPGQFVFPATAAGDAPRATHMSDVAIRNTLRNYGKSGQEFWISLRKPGQPLRLPIHAEPRAARD